MPWHVNAYSDPASATSSKMIVPDHKEAYYLPFYDILAALGSSIYSTAPMCQYQGELTRCRLSAHDVVTMASHPSCGETHRFYLAIRNDLLDRARRASSATLKSITVAELLQVPTEVYYEIGLLSVTTGQAGDWEAATAVLENTLSYSSNRRALA